MLNFLRLIRQIFFKSINKNFYSQFGEDKVLNELIKKNHKNGFYVDVGCYHPKKHSNTYNLYNQKKWNGINIDIEEDKIKAFKVLRPNDVNICCPISNKKRNIKVFKEQSFGLKSRIINSKKIDNQTKETKKLNDIIDNSKFKNRKIDLLNIDTEGNDFDVLKSLDIKKYEPKIILVESHKKDIKEILNSKIYKYLKKNKYKLRSWNFFTLIYVKNNSKILVQRQKF